MILVTGATGFVGKALCASLVGSVPIRAAVRNIQTNELPDEVEVSHGVLSPRHDWREALVGIRGVVHCAARVHVMNDKSPNPLADFRRVNVDATLHLARQAAGAGVKRFVFLSSIKVNGEQTQLGQPFTAEQPANPGDPYGISKMEAEEGLLALALETGMEVVVIRCPLVYGPGVKANFGAMMRWLQRGIPLPFGLMTENRRSLIALDNLIDLIGVCLDHPAAANQTFLVSDSESLSTAALLRRMGAAIGRPAWLIPLPVFLLRHGGLLFGKSALMQRLCGSLEVDMSKTCLLLGWVPPITVDEGLRRTAADWISSWKASRG